MMKQEALFKRLGIILDELNEQFEYLSQNPEQLSEVEMELFLANANFLTDHIQIVRKLNMPVVANAVEKNIEIESKSPTINDEFVEDLKDEQQLEAITFAETGDEQIDQVQQDDISFEAQIESAKEQEIFKLDLEPEKTFEFILNTDGFSEDDKFDFEEKSVNELFDRPLSEEEATILAQKQVANASVKVETEELEEDEIGPEPFLVQQITPKPVPEIVAVTEEKSVEAKIEVEPFVVANTDYKPTINDILAGKNSPTRINESTNNVVSDLKSAISLNDKLLFIKDLFNGYNLAYAEAIELANKMPNFDTADNFFQKNYAEKYNWADKQATVDKFYLLLNRRFKD